MKSHRGDVMNQGVCIQLVRGLRNKVGDALPNSRHEDETEVRSMRVRRTGKRSGRDCTSSSTTRPVSFARVSSGFCSRNWSLGDSRSKK